MADCSNSKHPLQRSGTSQNERLLPGLQQDYVQVDERTDKDWIVFAKTFSRYIRYFDKTNTASGNWAPFFANDIAASLASVAVQDLDEYRRTVKQYLDFLKMGHRPDDDPQMKINFTILFSAIGTLAVALDEHLARLPEKHAFALLIRNLIDLKLSPAIQRLLAFYKAAIDPKHQLTAALPSVEWAILDKPIVHFSFVYNNGLGKHWLRGAKDWASFVPPKDESIFGAATTHKIYHAAYHNLFTSVFDTFLTIFTRIHQEAGLELEKSINKFPGHQPHYALFLSFLKLFRDAKQSLNSITGRHLDFYYKEILQLKPKVATPDSAHVLVQLSRHASRFLLPKDSLFRAGKDDAGNERFYRLTKDTSFNHATAVSFKAVYQGGEEDNIVDGNGKVLLNNSGRLFAAPVMNSDDGLGKELSSANGEWHPFVARKYTNGILQEIAMPQAKIGFAIASHYLYLTEGERKVTVIFTISHKLAWDKVLAEAYLTTAKTWLHLSQGRIKFKDVSTGSIKAVELSFTLTGNEPPIVNYNAPVHGGSFQAQVPMLKLYLLHAESGASFLYDNKTSDEALKNLTVSHIELKVEVGTAAADKGLKQLLLASDFGPLDPAKPYQPFGPFAAKDAALVIGHKEIFSKKSRVSLHLYWANLPDDVSKINYKKTGDYPKAKVAVLSEGSWKTDKEEVDIFDALKTPVKIFSSGRALEEEAITGYRDPYTFNAAAANGFLRLSLSDDFGHKLYQAALTDYLIDKAKNNTARPADLVEPYVPAIAGLYASYSASVGYSLTSNNDFRAGNVHFYHLYPFGEVAQHAVISKQPAIYLFPQFSHGSGSGREVHKAEFYMGFENLSANDAVNVLFQVLEGTSNPRTLKPDKHLHWSYLGENTWKDFDRSEVSDATLDLARTGIISFLIPADATTTNTVLPAGFLWIRAAVTEAVDAVNKLIGIFAQVAVVTFDDSLHPELLRGTNVAPGTITKLKEPVSEIKKVRQPFPGFGGKAKEQKDQYYVRVSERLRHKGRAITIWDYEHLVLEAFPQIHKVKCLSHTRFDKSESEAINVYNENRPGHVCVITIPNLASRNDINPLKPYTPQSLLLEIEDFLRKRTTSHASVHVRNPEFEEISLSFQLKLAAGYDDFNVYEAMLQEEIMRFLSPWAYDASSDIQFGGSIYKSTLIDFIEERYYVDFITNVKMFHNLNPGVDAEEIKASTARSILVSVPASDHKITPEPKG